MQLYVIKFVSVLWQVGGFLRVLRFSPGNPVSSTNKNDCHDITEIFLNVALNTITLSHSVDHYCLLSYIF